MAWFNFTGTDPSQPSHYTFLPTGLPSCLGLQEELCAIQDLNDGSNNPVLDTPIQSEITNALQNQMNSTNVRLKARTP